MNSQNICAIISEVLELTTIVTENDSSETIVNWDSLAQLQILVRIDQETGGKAANIPELAVALSVKDIVSTLKNNGLIDE